jgi:hypothetical protein
MLVVSGGAICAAFGGLFGAPENAKIVLSLAVAIALPLVSRWVQNRHQINNMDHTDAGGWGTGDTVAVAGGIIYLILGLCRLPARRTFDGFVVLLATGVSLAPLVMILIDPLFQNISTRVFGIQHPTHLIEIVVTEARITLWWASAVAAAYLVKEFFIRTTTPSFLFPKIKVFATAGRLLSTLQRSFPCARRRSAHPLSDLACCQE